MARYRISQLARLVGVPATTLRYYETQGLLPARRTPGGYRIYDDHDVERVRFIAAAKDLGIPLTRIRDLLGVWQHGPCRDVRSRLLPLLAERITDLDRRTADFGELRRDLVRARQRLDSLPSRDRPCDPDCAFPTTPVAALPPGTGTVPIACSLSGDDHAARLAAWHSALSGTAPRRLDAGTVEVRVPTTRIAAIAALVADEVACCPFLRFTLTVTHDGVRLHAGAPPEAVPLLDDLLPRSGTT